MSPSQSSESKTPSTPNPHDDLDDQSELGEDDTAEYKAIDTGEHETIINDLTPDSLSAKVKIIELPKLPSIIGRYRLERYVGEGGTARVYYGVDLDGGPPIAFKLLRRRFHDDFEIRKAFAQQGAMLETFRMPNLAEAYSTGESQWGPWWALRWVEGVTLNHLIQQGVQWKAVDLHTLMLQVCEALDVLHSVECVHGDLKPENLIYSGNPRMPRSAKITLIDMRLHPKLSPVSASLQAPTPTLELSSFDKNPDSQVPKALSSVEDDDNEGDVLDRVEDASSEPDDFEQLGYEDISPVLDSPLPAPLAPPASPDQGVHSASHPLTPFIFGTPCYMSPEHVRGETLSPASDLYSLGVLMFELCTGTTPFVGSIARVIKETLHKPTPAPSKRQNPWPYSAQLEALILNLLSKRSSARCQSAKEVKMILERELQSSLEIEFSITADYNLDSNTLPLPQESTLEGHSEGRENELLPALPSQNIDTPVGDRKRVKSARLKSSRSAQEQLIPSRRYKGFRYSWMTNLVWMCIGASISYLLMQALR
jgi:serine/threonine protein kinase